MIVDIAKKLVKVKIVYYGIAQSGKTTNVEALAKMFKSELLSVDTKGEKTLVFDFLSQRETVEDLKLSYSIYTIPGQSIYSDIRKVVMRGVDALVYVVDSQRERLKENIDFWDVLREDLKEIGKKLEDIPTVVQFNKMDLPNALDQETLEKKVNIYGFPSQTAIAVKGLGVGETYLKLKRLLLEKIKKEVGL